MFKALGPDTGWDSISDGLVSAKLARILDALDRDALLPRTILYCLNPVHNEVLGAMDRQFPGWLRAGQDTVRLWLVVQRPEGRHDPPDDRVGDFWATSARSSA